MPATRYAIDIHPLVKGDHNDAYHWYEMRQKGLGERFLTNIRAKLELIQAGPDQYGERTQRGYREAMLDEFPYLIVYKVYKKERRVFVCSICHSKMHPKNRIRKPMKK